MTTRWKISEQILNILKGKPGAASSITLKEVMELVTQTANNVLRVQHFDSINAGGEMIPEGLVLACYDNLTVFYYKDVAACTLPAVPVKLPKGMGVWHVSKTDELHNPFIPIPRGMTAMIGGEPLISDLLDQIGYEVRVDENSSPALIFDKDITDASVVSPAVTSVYVEMVILDLSKYGDYDLFPVTPDMEAQIIETVVKLLSVAQPPDEIVDPTSEQR